MPRRRRYKRSRKKSHVPEKGDSNIEEEEVYSDSGNPKPSKRRRLIRPRDLQTDDAVKLLLVCESVF